MGYATSVSQLMNIEKRNDELLRVCLLGEAVLLRVAGF